MEFSPKFYLFCECNSVRFSQNIPKRGIVGKIYLCWCCCLPIYYHELKGKWVRGKLYTSYHMGTYTTLVWPVLRWKRWKTWKWLRTRFCQPLAKLRLNNRPFSFLRPFRKVHLKVHWLPCRICLQLRLFHEKISWKSQISGKRFYSSRITTSKPVTVHRF